KAGPLYLKSFKIRQRTLGDDHPDVAQSLSNLAAVYGSLRLWNESARYFDLANRVYRRHTFHILPVLSEPEQLNFLTSNQGWHSTYHAALSLGLHQRGDARTVGLSLGWLLNGKAVTQEALAEARLQEHDRTSQSLASRELK